MLERVAHFQILSKLGQGGMGVVFKARDTKLRRAVALKLLPAEHLRDAERRARFMREARAAAAITHANIATVYEVGEDDDGRVFIAMELVEGESLRDRLAAGAMAPAAVLPIARQLARGLAKAHAAGLVHRDLKPDNVMVGREGEVKILDFGLAKERELDLALAATGEVDPGHITAAGVILGTPGYMSPEQATGKVVDARSDVFSFGVVLFELLTGELPFRGRTVGELLAAVARDEARDIRELAPDITPGLAELVTRCLAKSPADRPADAGALGAAIEAGSSTPPAVARTERVAVSVRPPGPAVRVAALAIGAAVAVSGACAVAIGAHFLLAKKPVAVAPADAASDAGARLVDLPLPACNEAARAHYRAGLEAARSRGTEYGVPLFEEAIKADPTCAAAHLRAAVHWSPTARAHYTQASVGAERLDERDRDLLAAFEPSLSRAPADSRETARRLYALTKKYPRDVELIILLGYLLWEDDPHGELLRYAETAVALDPGFTAAWQLLATARQVGGDDEGTRKAFEECENRIASSVDCVRELADLAKASGRCAEMEHHARSFVARTLGDTKGHLMLARAITASGGTREAAVEAIRLYASGSPGRAKRAKVEEARLALAFGDFAGAETLFADVERGLKGSQDRSDHAGPAQQLFELHLETGRTEAGLGIAEAFAARERAWTGTVDEFYGTNEEGLLLVPRMLALQLRGGKITAAKRDAALATWFDKNVLIKEPIVKWVVHHGALLETAAEAESAVAALPTEDAGRRHVVQLRALPAAMYGRALALGGRREDGIRELQRFTQRCELLDAPIANTQAHLWLGEALEATNKKAEACTAYRVVVSRWGSARPPSKSAQRAAERLTALACP